MNVVLATNTSCPTWHYYNNATGLCKCGFLLYCSSDGNKVEIRNGYCATSLGHEGNYYVGKCPFSFNSTNRMFAEMPSNASQLDEVMCGPYNRRGLLCGEYKDGYGPAVYSFDQKCANCSHLRSEYAIPLYLLLQFLQTMLIFVCLVAFHFNIISGPLLGYVIFCLASVTYKEYVYAYIKSNASSSLGVFFRFSFVLSHVWDLQLFKAILPPFCISDKLNSIHIHMLNLILAIYSLVLVIVSCILMDLHAKNCKIVRWVWRPFGFILTKVNITTVTSDAVFHAFATFIFLSNVSVLFSKYYYVLNTTYVYNATGSVHNKVLRIDPTEEWLSQQSVSSLFLGAVVLIIISVIPSLLLCIYPTRVYRYLSRFLSTRKRLAITAFAEALNSCFKDGLNGTRDYRALAGATPFLFLLSTAVKYLLGSIAAFDTFDLLATVMWMMLVCVISYMKPCRSQVANISLIFHMTLFGFLMCIIYMWEYFPSFETYTLELAIAATFLTPHILVAVWAGYTLTKHTLTRFGYQFHGPGCKVALSDMANGVRLCLCRRHRDYQEMEEQ